MSRIIIKDGITYTGAEVISRATVVIEGKTIARIVPTPADRGGAPTPADESVAEDTAGRQEGDVLVSAAGRLVTPGLVNAHTHIYSALARGIPLKDPPPANFLENLERLWWRLDRALTVKDVELSARLHGIDCLKSGVTTVFDHHASQRAIRGSLEAISRALADLGLRACLSFEVSDREGPEAVREGIEENRAFMRETGKAGGTLRRAMFGLHASMTLSDATLEACVQAAVPDATGFHIHVGEDAADQEDSRNRHGVRVIERLRRSGVLGRKTICVHGVHLDDREIAILAGSGGWLVHCPESNMNNAVGAVSLGKLQSAGVRVALGTDGFTANVVREALVAHLLQNHLTGDPREGYATVAGLLFGANAALASETFGVDLGRLRPGDPADIVVWDYCPPTPITTDNLWGHILFGLADARAEDVIVSGRHVLRRGQPTTCDEAELGTLSTRAAERLWERF